MQVEFGTLNNQLTSHHKVAFHVKIENYLFILQSTTMC